MTRRKILLSALFFTLTGIMIYSCQNPARIEQDKYQANGRDLYIQHCQNCHGAHAEGLGDLTPPLTDTTYLKDHKHQLACIIKNGLSGPVTVQGRLYEGKMPDFPTLANIDLAQLIVYITNSSGSKQGMYQPEQVAADLKNCK